MDIRIILNFYQFYSAKLFTIRFCLYNCVIRKIPFRYTKQNCLFIAQKTLRSSPLTSLTLTFIFHISSPCRGGYKPGGPYPEQYWTFLTLTHPNLSMKINVNIRGVRYNVMWLNRPYPNILVGTYYLCFI